MKKSLIFTTLAAAGALFAAPASAATVFSNEALTNPNTAPDGSVLCDFETNDCGATGTFSIENGTSAEGATPLGNNSNYISVPGNDVDGGNGDSAFIDLTQFTGDISLLGFDWGSIDTYNTLTLFTNVGSYVFSGALFLPADGDRSDPATNRRFVFEANAGEFFTGIGLQSSRPSGPVQAMEIDNISAVPEPTTWLMLILGLFGVGAAMRRQKAAQSGSLAVS
ncbi:MAG: PEPxxWA-CTERM sorting domain-containing protein [Pseudomonadota bacterium]